VRLDGSNVTLYKYVNGRGISVAGPSGYSVGGTAASVWIKLSGTTIKVWVAGTLEINTTDSSIREGGLAFGGTAATFDNLKVGHDNNANDRVNDSGDDLFVDEAFGSTSKSVAHDKAGNLVDDGAFWYKYDAWNRLVKVQQAADGGALTIQTAGYDGSGRRVKKVVTNSGDLDGTTKYLYKGWQIVETRDGSDNLVQQFIHGTQYIDELVMVRTKDKGELYYHQDANWNVIAMTDLAGRVAERYVLTPYGEVTVHQERGYGDYDGDGDVDSTDYNAIAGACSGSSSGACRVLDVNNSGTVNSSDQTPHAALPQGLLRRPGQAVSGLGQVCAHQGLPLDAEVGSYQNRTRDYPPQHRRLGQRDSIGLAFLTRLALPGKLPQDRMNMIGLAQYLGDRNLYEAVRSNPTRLSDPMGLTPSPPSPCGGEICTGTCKPVFALGVGHVCEGDCSCHTSSFGGTCDPEMCACKWTFWWEWDDFDMMYHANLDCACSDLPPYFLPPMPEPPWHPGPGDFPPPPPGHA